MTARIWPSRLLRALVLITGVLLFSSQLALVQFTQEGSKLVGTGALGAASHGGSVALSGDGNTAIVGGPKDSSGTGAAWVYTRSNGVWTQQGNKLVGTGAVNPTGQGGSVALSGDGNTAIVGGDNAAWVYTRSNGVWTQQGMVGGGGFVALSADGNTAIVNLYVYIRSNGVWIQQGGELFGTGAVGGAYQGYSVALSADGNTAFIGGPGDNSETGAAWVFTRNNGGWIQQGSKLIGTGAVFPARQGYSVSLSADGNTAIVGGSNDSSGTGAAWVYTRSNGLWTQQGNKLVGAGAVGSALQATPLPYPPTAKPPSWAGLMTTRRPERRGSLCNRRCKSRRPQAWSLEVILADPLAVNPPVPLCLIRFEPPKPPAALQTSPDCIIISQASWLNGLPGEPPNRLDRGTLLLVLLEIARQQD
jgi:hypothetical protein